MKGVNTPMVPIILEYRSRQTGIEKVELYGAWDDWADPILMNRVSPNSNRWRVTKDLPPGCSSFKFMVNSEWTLSPNYDVVDNGIGGKNNSVIVLPPRTSGLPRSNTPKSTRKNAKSHATNDSNDGKETKGASQTIQNDVNEDQNKTFKSESSSEDGNITKVNSKPLEGDTDECAESDGNNNKYESHGGETNEGVSSDSKLDESESGEGVMEDDKAEIDNVIDDGVTEKNATADKITDDKARDENANDEVVEDAKIDDVEALDVQVDNDESKDAQVADDKSNDVEADNSRGHDHNSDVNKSRKDTVNTDSDDASKYSSTKLEKEGVKAGEEMENVESQWDENEDHDNAHMAEDAQLDSGGNERKEGRDCTDVSVEPVEINVATVQELQGIGDNEVSSVAGAGIESKLSSQRGIKDNWSMDNFVPLHRIMRREKTTLPATGREVITPPEPSTSARSRMLRKARQEKDRADQTRSRSTENSNKCTMS